jgi:hypothetical protein
VISPELSRKAAAALLVSGLDLAGRSAVMKAALAATDDADFTERVKELLPDLEA